MSEEQGGGGATFRLLRGHGNEARAGTSYYFIPRSSEVLDG